MPMNGDYLKVDLNFLGPAAAPASCRLYYDVTAGGAPDSATMNTLADTFLNKFDTALVQCIPGTCQLVNVRVLWEGNADQFEGFSTDGAQDGTVSSEFFGEEIAVVIQRRTNLRGRNFRGRIFLPFVPLTFVSESTLTATAITKYTAFGALMETNTTYGGVTYRPCTPNFKDSSMTPMVQTRLVGEIMSRRDRRFPKRPTVFT